MADIFINQVIEFIDSDFKTHLYRVVWMDQHRKNLMLFDMEDELAFPEKHLYQDVENSLLQGSARILPYEPYRYLYVAKEEDIVASHKIRRDRAWNSIKDIIENHLEELFAPNTRGPLTTAAAIEHNTTERLIILRLRAFWRKGMRQNALLPNYRPPPEEANVPNKNPGTGRPGEDKPVEGKKLGRKTAVAVATGITTGIKVVPEIGSVLAQGYKLFYIRQQLTLEQAYDKTINTRFNNGYDFDPAHKIFIPALPPSETLPSIEQFRYWGEKSIDPIRRRRQRKGGLRYQMEDAPALDSSIGDLPGPGFEYQIDATIGDIYLLSSRDRSRIIGRPVIYVIIDAWSRMIVGFAVTLEGPSWLGAMLALETVTMDKVALCAQYGITIHPGEWPCYHLSAAILADRGELLSGKAKNMIETLGTRISNTPAYRADWKGIVERNFGLINTGLLKWLPGAVYHREGRGAPDYRLDAKLTLNEFRQLMILHILRHNNTHAMKWYPIDPDMAADHLEPYPIELWLWGIKNRSGSLRTEDQNIVRANLLPEEDASITNRGISFQGLLYTSDHPQLTHDFHQARKGRKSIKIVHNPRSIAEVYVRLDNGRTIVTCPLKTDYLVYKGFDWYEILDEFAIQAQTAELAETRDRQKKARYQALQDSIVANAELQAPDTSGMSKRSRTGNIKANRKDEREYERQQAAQSSVSNAASPTAESDELNDTAPQSDRNRRLLEKLQKGE